jgi:hypothetical protein
MNILQISKQPISYMGLTDSPPAAFFLGGIRFQNFLPAESLAAGKAKSWSSVFYLGDNEVTSTKVADALTAEYKKVVPTLAVRNGSGGEFDAQQGYWQIAKSGDPISISARGELHSPAFLISGWNGEVPPTVTVGNAAKTLNSDFVAAKIDASHLLVQVLLDVPKGASIGLSRTSPK